MDEIADQTRGGASERTPRILPRYVAEHLGQVLRNRLRDTLFMPLSGEMLRAIEALPQGTGARDFGLAPLDSDTESATGG
jgi:hypothetical protein